jgi:hypothetical protein
MAITSVAGLISGLQPPIPLSTLNLSVLNVAAGLGYSSWGAGSIYAPSGGTYPGTLAGSSLSGGPAFANNVTGQLPWQDPPSGNAYLARLEVIFDRSGSNPVGGAHFLLDRLWHNGTISASSSSVQTIGSPTWPSRDVNGATTGVGVLLGLEVTTAVPSTASFSVSVSYTNAAGASGLSAVNINSLSSISGGLGVGTFIPLGLNAGDTGVGSVQSITISNPAASGVMSLVAYRPVALATIENTLAGMRPAVIDGVTAGLPRMFAGSVPFLVFGVSSSAPYGSTNVAGWNGQIQYAFG